MSADETEILLQALKAASRIKRQHNLLSTATEQDRRETIARFTRWWNDCAVPAIARAERKSRS